MYALRGFWKKIIGYIVSEIEQISIAVSINLQLNTVYSMIKAMPDPPNHYQLSYLRITDEYYLFLKCLESFWSLIQDNENEWPQ